MFTALTISVAISAKCDKGLTEAPDKVSVRNFSHLNYCAIQANNEEKTFVL